MASVAAAAQVAGGPPVPSPGATFSSRSELVLVPVIVHDHNGAAVHNLSREDFIVTENGKEQKISTFEEIRPTNAPVAPLKSVMVQAAAESGQKSGATFFTNARPADFAPRRINIVVIDTLNTAQFDQTLATKALMQFLEQTATDDELTTVLQLHQGGLKVIYDFTTDRKVLAKAMDLLKTHPELMSGKDASGIYATMPDSMAAYLAQGITMSLQEMGESIDTQLRQNEAIETTLESLRAISRAYAGIPGRKSLLWLTGGFPFLLTQINQPQFPGMAMGSGIANRGFELDFSRVFNELNSANIAVYPIDARGLVVVAAEPSRGPQKAPVGGMTPLSRMEATLNASLSNANNDKITTLMTFAAATGGQAFFNTNDIHSAIQRADQDSASYYVLGYYIRHEGAKGWRSLAVKVKQPGMRIRSRAGYFLVKETQASAEEQRIRDVAKALSSPFDYTSFHFSVRWNGISGPDASGKKTIKFAMLLDKDSMTIDDADSQHLDLDIVAVASDSAANATGQIAKKLQGHLTPDYAKKILSTGLAYDSEFALAPGQYVVKFVVRDNISGRVGSVSAPLSVN